MKKILIVGVNGAGKTTFAKELSEILDIPLIFIDKIYRTDNWCLADKEYADSVINSALSEDSWIIDGNNKTTLTDRLKCCDTVFYFDFNTVSCLVNCIKRTIKNYGVQRDDVGGSNNIEKFDLNKLYFFKSVLFFNRNNRKDYYDMINSVQGLNLIVFKNRKQVNEYLKKIRKQNENY